MDKHFDVWRLGCQTKVFRIPIKVLTFYFSKGISNMGLFYYSQIIKHANCLAELDMLDIYSLVQFFTRTSKSFLYAMCLKRNKDVIIWVSFGICKNTAMHVAESGCCLVTGWHGVRHTAQTGKLITISKKSFLHATSSKRGHALHYDNINWFLSGFISFKFKCEFN